MSQIKNVSVMGRMFSLVVTGTLFMSILGTNIFNYRGEQVFYTQLLRSNAWAAWQLEREYHRFSHSILAYGVGMHGVDHDQLKLRFEVLLSRIPVVSIGAEAEMLRSFEGDVEVVEDLKRHLFSIEQQVSALIVGDWLGAAELFSGLRTFEDRLVRFSTRATLGPEIEQIRARLSEAQTRNFWLIIALAISAIILIMQLIVETIIGRQLASRERNQRKQLLRVVSENRRLSDRIASLVSVAPVGIYALEYCEKATRNTYASDSCQLLTGFEQRELLSIRGFLARVPRQDKRTLVAALRALPRKGAVLVEHRFIRADGVTVWFSHSLRYVANSGGSTRELVGVISDISERKTADIALQQGSKLIMLGEMATGLAHELNQPLSVIRMAAQNAIASLDGDDSSKRILTKLERINAQTTRAARMIDQMRIFGRPPSLEQEQFSLRDAVLGAVDLVYEQLDIAGIRIAAPEIDDSISIKGSQQQLEQAIVNILLNARDAFRDRQGKHAAGDEKTIRIEVGASKSQRVNIVISDNAGGIAPSVIDKVFNPFVTTKQAASGTGLGLWLAFGFVTQMDGIVKAANIPGGACFEIDLPLSGVKERLNA